MPEPEKSGVHLTGNDSGWPVAAPTEPGSSKDGTGDDTNIDAIAVGDGTILVEGDQPAPG